MHASNKLHLRRIADSSPLHPNDRVQGRSEAFPTAVSAYIYKRELRVFVQVMRRTHQMIAMAFRSSASAEEPAGLEFPKRDARVIQRSRSDGDRVLADDAMPAPDAAGEAADQQQLEEDEARSVRCECCGMAEDCTPKYISRVLERFHGRWVCGMCSEAVSELRRRHPALAVGEAVESHAKMCSEFNSTVRVNPTLYLARSMRDIARRCHDRSGSAPSAAPGGGSRIGRTRSCALP